jgi:hypothetical protein
MQGIVHFSAHCETLQTGPPALGIDLPTVSNDACKCRNLGNADRWVTQSQWKSSAQGAAHVLAHYDISHGGPPAMRISCPNITKGAHKCKKLENSKG